MKIYPSSNWILILTGFLVLLACSKKPDPSPSPSPSPSPEVFQGVRIYVVSTGDIHEYSQNLAGLATLVKNIRDTASYVYFVLAGDFFMLHKGYDVKKCNGVNKYLVPDLKVPTDSNHIYDGLAESQIVEYLNFDAIVPGNHDWCYGISMLEKSTLKQKLVACNIHKPANLAADYISFSSAQGNFSLNIIGLAATDNVHNKPDETVKLYYLKHTTFSKIDSAIATAKINVLLTHFTAKQDDSVFLELKNSPGKVPFDVLCGGHTHKDFATMKDSAAYTKAGLYGTYAGLTCIWWDTVKKKVVHKSTKNVCLENVPKDPGTLALIESLHQNYPHY